MEQANIHRPHALPSFSSEWALFLDVDGTLLEFGGRPQDVSPRAALTETLEVLRRSVPLALVSGRAIADLDRLFAPLVLPIAGQHGAERRSLDGGMTCAPVSRPGLERLRDAMSEWASAHAGILVEDKGLSLALHCRLAPGLMSEAGRTARELTRQLLPDFEVIGGNMVWEVRSLGCDKGRAIDAFMGKPPFFGRLPVFIGDDIGDEAAFESVNAFGGHSFKVGPGPTAARYRLADVAEVLVWLQSYAAWLETASGVSERQS